MLPVFDKYKRSPFWLALRLDRFSVRLSLLVALTLTATMLVFSSYTASTQSSFSARTLQQQSETLARNIGTTGTAYLIIEDLQALENLLRESVHFPGVLSIQVYDATGWLMSAVANSQGKVHVDLQQTQANPPADIRVHTITNDASMEIWHPVIQKELLGWVHVETSLATVKKLQADIWQDSLVAAGLGTVISISILVVFFARPMRALYNATAFAERLAKLRGQTIDVDSDITEISRLGDALNQASQKLYTQESALKESGEWLRATLDNTIDAIITIDAHGIIESFNPAAEKLFGYSPLEAVGNNVSMLMPEPFASRHDAFLDRYLSTGTRKIIGIRRELVGLRRNGDQFPLELGVSVVKRKGRVAFIGVVRDLTEAKAMEQMKSEFVSTVSHELRTPLTSIRGALALVQGGAVGTVPEKAEELLSLGLNNCDRLMHIINDILDIGKMESGKMVFDFQPLSVADAINQALADNRIYAEQFEVRFRIENETLPEVLIYGDLQRLNQVIANFLSNAAKFSSPGDTVWICVTKKASGVRVSVTDNGPGIDPSFRDRIFQKFAQADSSDTRGKGGTGLGLHICKAIIEKHAGTIGFEDAPGGGTCFFFELQEWRQEDSENTALHADHNSLAS